MFQKKSHNFKNAALKDVVLEIYFADLLSKFLFRQTKVSIKQF